MLVDRNLSMQYMKEEYSTALQSLKKSLECNPWKSKEFGVKSVVIKFGSFEITLLNGTTYITCAHPCKLQSFNYSFINSKITTLSLMQQNNVYYILVCYEKGLMNPVKTKGVYFRCEKHCLTLKHPGTIISIKFPLNVKYVMILISTYVFPFIYNRIPYEQKT